MEDTSSLTSSMIETYSAKTIINDFIFFSGEIYGDHGLLSHFTPLNFTQGVVRNRKAICNVPLEMEIVADPKKMQLDITVVNPKSKIFKLVLR